MSRSIRLVSMLLLTLLATACGRQYSVSVNEQVMYDPRPGSAQLRVPDPGLQSCINVALRDSETTPADIEILSCADLEIETLDGIAGLPDLRFLDVGGNELEHLDPLAGMRELVSVRAPDNPLNDVSGLLDIATLTSAVLSGSSEIPCEQLDELEEELGNDLLRPGQCAE